MGISSLQPNGSFTHTLTEKDMPDFSHTIPREYGVGSGINYLLNSQKTPAGYLVIADSYKIPVYEKPHPKHLHNMKKTFGWTWEKYV